MAYAGRLTSTTALPSSHAAPPCSGFASRQDGRSTLAHAPGSVRAQIEGPGVAYRWNAGGYGYVGFVPLAKIEQRLGKL